MIQQYTDKTKRSTKKNEQKKKRERQIKDYLGVLHIPHFKHVAVFDDNIIHVRGLELVKILRERDEMDCGCYVELKEIRVIIVPFPPK